MTIHLGYGGLIKLQREATSATLRSRLDPDDVNVAERRFSFDFDYSVLRSGDRLRIGTTDQSDMQLVAAHDYPDTSAYVHIDEAGGIRLYADFFDALEGRKDKARELKRPTIRQEIDVSLDDNDFRCVAQVGEYEFTTSRDAIDITQLGDEFKQNYANGLISGQGTVDCFWDYDNWLCDQTSGDVELPHYLAQLVIRTQMGGSFVGQFYLHRPETESEGASDSLYYEARCIITNCVMAINPQEPVMTKISFIVTGPFQLKRGGGTDYLLQESSDKVLQEDASGILLDD